MEQISITSEPIIYDYNPFIYYGLFCGCSGKEVLVLYNDLENVKLKKDLPSGVLDLLNILDEDSNIKGIDEIGEEGINLIEWCVDFLLFISKYDEDNDPIFKKKDQSGVDGEKYITINSFIYNYLGLSDNGYKFWLLNVLHWYKICTHGSSMIHSQLEWDRDNPYRDRKLSKEREIMLVEWVKNAPDDI